MTEKNDDRDTLRPPAGGDDAYSAPTVVTETPEDILEAIKAARAATLEARPQADAERPAAPPTSSSSTASLGGPHPTPPSSSLAREQSAPPVEPLPPRQRVGAPPPTRRAWSALTERQRMVVIALVAALVFLIGVLAIAIAFFAFVAAPS